MSQTEKRIAGLNHEERAALNMLAVNGMNNVAHAIEWLISGGETILLLMIGGPTPRIEIVPPCHASKLWRESDTCRSTQAEVSFFASRYGCEIRWTMTHAEAELRRPQRGARGMH